MVIGFEVLATRYTASIAKKGKNWKKDFHQSTVLYVSFP